MAKSNVEQAQVAMVRIEAPRNLIEQVKKDVAKVPTEQLVPFYVAGDGIVKQIEALKKTAKEEILKRKEQAGEKFGDNSQHRLFHINGVYLQVMEKQSWGLDETKCMAFLKKKRLVDQGTTMTLTISDVKNSGFQAFLKEHKDKLAEMGVVVERHIDDDAIAAMVASKQISQEEFDSLLDKKEPTYSLVPSAPRGYKPKVESK